MKFEKPTLLFLILVLLIGATVLTGCAHIDDHKAASAAADTGRGSRCKQRQDSQHHRVRGSEKGILAGT